MIKNIEHQILILTTPLKEQQEQENKTRPNTQPVNSPERYGSLGKYNNEIKYKLQYEK